MTSTTSAVEPTVGKPVEDATTPSRARSIPRAGWLVIASKEFGDHILSSRFLVLAIIMSNTFAPGVDGEYLMFTQDHGQNQQEIARHSKHDADAYDQYSHDMEMVCQAIKPLLDMVPPDIFSDDPEEMIALANVGSRFKKMDKRVLHNAVRLLTGSAADFLDDYFESDLLKGYLSSSSIIGTKVGPRSQGSGLVLLYHSIGEHDGEFGAWHRRPTTAPRDAAV